MINRLSQNSPITFPDRYASHARGENTELINTILNDLKPSFACLNPNFSLAFVEKKSPIVSSSYA